jgi:hypothetical protein
MRSSHWMVFDPKTGRVTDLDLAYPYQGTDTLTNQEVFDAFTTQIP